jgi:hypothetical protein
VTTTKEEKVAIALPVSFVEREKGKGKIKSEENEFECREVEGRG